MSQRHQNKKGFLSYIPAALVNSLAILGVLALIVFAFDLIFLFFPLKTDESISARLGVFGDFFGGFLNPIVSIVGFIAVLYTLNSQRQDAEEQEKSVALANKTQIKQQFEGTFFRLLEILYYSLKNARKGLDFRSPIKDIYNCYEKNSEFNIYQSLNYKDITYYYNQPFRALKAILEFVDSFYYEGNPADLAKDKNLYVNLVLNLVHKELMLIFIMQVLENKETFGYEQEQLKIKKLLNELGALRELDYSPFNTNICNNDVAYNQLNITQFLSGTFSEQAFKPIEAPPASA